MGDVGRMFGFGEPQLAANQEMKHVSYGAKLKSSFSGMCLGFLLFFGSLATAGWNEYRNVANQKTINEARESFHEGNCSTIMPELEGALVHVTCPVTNLQVLGGNDRVLMGIPEAARTGISLKSYMEVYAWGESASTTSTDDKVGGGTTTVTTYSYSRGWSFTTPADNTTFFKNGDTCKSQNGGLACYNWDPADEPWWNNQFSLGTKIIDESTNVQAGDYVLPNDVLSRLGSPEVLTPTCAAANSSSSVTVSPTTSAPRDNLLACAPGNNAALKGKKMVWQQKDSNGAMTDYLTRSYTIYTTDTVSVLAQQKGNSFVMWGSSYDDDYGFYHFDDGNYTAPEMIDNQEAANEGLTWFLRFFTLILCIVGLVMITAPLTEIPDIIPLCGPFMGDLIGYALWFVDCVCGCCCWSIVVSIAWISYRPIVAVPLLCVSGGLCALGGYAVYTQKGKRAEAQSGSGDGEEGKVEATGDDGEPDIEVAEEYNPEVDKE